MRRIGAGALAYLVPTFALGFIWHLVAFKGYYDELAMYRRDVIVPFGFLAMALQAVLFAWVLDHGGAITGEHGIGLAKKPWIHQALGDVAFDVHLALKDALDPQGILNPGKFLDD